MNVNKEYRRCYKKWKRDFKPRWDFEEIKDFLYIALLIFGLLVSVGTIVTIIILVCINPVPEAIGLCVFGCCIYAVAAWQFVKGAVSAIREYTG